MMCTTCNIKPNGFIIGHDYNHLCPEVVSEFNKLANMFCTNLFHYVNRSTPRTKLGGKIYTATEYPADKSIPFHNENSYTLEWPNKILFFSVIASETGGETAIADSRCVYNNINPEIIDKFNELKVLYIRNYNEGIDLSWQEVFQTNEQKEVRSNRSNLPTFSSSICNCSIPSRSDRPKGSAICSISSSGWTSS